MHWLSLISLFLVIYLCQTQSVTDHQLPIDNIHIKSDTIDNAVDHNHFHASTGENPIDHTIQPSTSSHISIEIPVRFVKEGRQTEKLVYNSAHQNYCYFIIPLIIGAFMGIIRF
ncbi:hypothetical protein I4U23_000692 [Adineta vaga]|nr:hypothetical protein I4U23_000692 [Adineta vaga]